MYRAIVALCVGALVLNIFVGLYDVDPFESDVDEFDTDSDGYDDVWEREMFSDLDTFGSGSDHNSADDPDNDGLTNQEEMVVGTNPLEEDTDGDGISDGQEKGDIIIPENFTVTVPEKKEGDLVSFGYALFGEMYWYDKNTGRM